MWLYTVDGFYSVVENWHDPDQVMIRARVREDLVKLADRVGLPELVDAIRDDIGTDYAYRFFVARDVWIEYLLAAGQALNYGNFKNAALAGQHGGGRSAAYHDVWAVMKRWQDQEHRQAKSRSDS